MESDRNTNQSIFGTLHADPGAVSIVNFPDFDRRYHLQTNDIEVSRGRIDFKISLG